MKRRISLSTCFALPGSDSEMMDLPERVKTIADLLGYMGREAGFVFLNPKSGDLEDDIEIILNGKEVWFYPGGLGVSFNDGDKLEIYPRPLGGG